MPKRKLDVGGADEASSSKKMRFFEEGEEDEDESEMDISAIEAMIPSQESSQIELDSLVSAKRISVSFELF